MRKDFCTLEIGRDYSEGEIPIGCWTQCERQFTRQDNMREYDHYSFSGHGEDGASEDVCMDMEAEYSHSVLSAQNIHERTYVVVDQCGEGHELGETIYAFRCPLSVEIEL